MPLGLKIMLQKDQNLIFKSCVLATFVAAWELLSDYIVLYLYTTLLPLVDYIVDLNFVSSKSRYWA